MTKFAILLALLIIGGLVALYLIWSRRKNGGPVCIIGKECHVVLESKYNRIFGIVHNDVMGLLYYLTMIALLNFLQFGIGQADEVLMAMRVIAGSGALMALIFTFIQWRVIKAWCFWCMVSNINSWIIAAIVFKLF